MNDGARSNPGNLVCMLRAANCCECRKGIAISMAPSLYAALGIAVRHSPHATFRQPNDLTADHERPVRGLANLLERPF